MYCYGPPHMAHQKQDDQLKLIYSSYVRIRDVAQETCRRRWTIGRSGERWSGLSVPAARHDDDIYICVYVCVCVCVCECTRPDGMDCRIHRLYLCRRGKTPITCVLVMTRKFIKWWVLEFRECVVAFHSPYSQVHSNPYLLASVYTASNRTVQSFAKTY